MHDESKKLYDRALGLMVGGVSSQIPMRDVSSGTEIVQVTRRLMHAHSGKPKYVKFGGHYHGWTDDMSYSVHPGEIGDVLMEPILGNSNSVMPCPSYLERPSDRGRLNATATT